MIHGVSAHPRDCNCHQCNRGAYSEQHHPEYPWCICENCRQERTEEYDEMLRSGEANQTHALRMDECLRTTDCPNEETEYRKYLWHWFPRTREN